MPSKLEDRYISKFPIRQKRQRYEKRLLPMMTFADGNNAIDFDTQQPIGTFIVTNKFDGFDQFSQPVAYEGIELTLNDGTIVPCYRVHNPESNYAICQSFLFKAIRTQKP